MLHRLCFTALAAVEDKTAATGQWLGILTSCSGVFATYSVQQDVGCAGDHQACNQKTLGVQENNRCVSRHWVCNFSIIAE